MNYELYDENIKKPIFEKIADWVVKNIAEEIVAKGDKLPTERELSEKFLISRGTVKAAYKQLEKDHIIETIQGSGSYILKGRDGLSSNKKREAKDLLVSTISKLELMGMTEKEIVSKVNHYFDSKHERKILNIAIIENNSELLLDLKKQLTYLENVALSIFILESITENPDPERFLCSFDIIITSSFYFDKVMMFLPTLGDKVIEAAISPTKQTLIDISAITQNARIGIICRSNVFLKIIKSTLKSFNFDESQILSFFEMDYKIDTYFPGGIDALISFGHAHIFTNPAFKERNKEFLDKNGKLIKFEYHIERGTLIYIEDKINQLLNQFE